MQMDNLTHLSIFSGIGGLDIAANSDRYQRPCEPIKMPRQRGSTAAVLSDI